ncbi:MAG TPA: hypothetical protein VGS22_09240 [Thermoanaerobaculia bacterium]|jgi:hypothetical protein|nr:hypothetical protein [Thermoanaerobaculia bacterium]
MAKKKAEKIDGEDPGSDNALSEEFLALLERLDDEAPGLNEATWSGDWEARFLGAGRWGVFRTWEMTGIHPPAVTFASYERALLAAAVLPGIGRSDFFHLDAEADSDGGFPLITMEGGPREVGVFSTFHPELLFALLTVEMLTRSPRSMAMVLQASGSDAIKLSGAVLSGRIAAQAREQDRAFGGARDAEPE